MNYLDIVIRQILDNFDFAYMLCCNILCFVMIKAHDEFNGTKKVPTWNKRLYLIVSILLLGIVYYNVGEVKVTVLVNSAILAPVFWSWVAAPVLRRFGVKYKQVDDALK